MSLASRIAGDITNLNEQAVGLATMLKERRAEREAKRKEKAQTAVTMEQLLSQTRGQNLSAVLQGMNVDNETKGKIVSAALTELERKRQAKLQEYF